LGAADPGAEISFTQSIFQHVAMEGQETAALEILEGSLRVLAVGPKCSTWLFMVFRFFAKAPILTYEMCRALGYFWMERHLKKN